MGSCLCSLVLILVCFISVSECVTCDEVDQCSCRLSDSNKVISLWGIDNQNDIVFPQVKIGKTEDYLRYNPCTPFNEDGGNCHQDIVCLHANKNLYSAGDPNKFNTDIEKDGSIIFKYIGKELDGKVRETEITLVCKADKLEPEIVNPVLIPNTTTKYSFSLHSHCACPGLCHVKPAGTGSNMSVGSILLTIFFVMLGAYFIFGHLFLKYHRHLDGESSIPNYEFWKELPTNVKEGFVFTKQMLCGREEGYEGI